MIYTTRAGRQAVVVDLEYYRNRKALRSRDRRKSDEVFLVAFAAYLRKRAGHAGTDPDGLKRLAVAVDLRRVRLVNTLTSMLGERYLIDSATIALGLAEHLDDLLTPRTDQASSASATAYQLAHALDAVAAELEIRRSSAHVTRR
jgi:hypothetical protein